MLNEHQINKLPERIYQRLAKMNTEYLTSIGEVIKKIGELRPTDVHKLQQMYNYGADVHKITNSLSAMSSKNVSEIYDIFDIVAKENYNFSKPFYKAKGMAFIPFEENESLQKYVKAIAKQTAGEYVNLTQHTAFSVFAKDGKSIAPLFASNKHKVATSLSDTYTKVIDYAVSKVQLGGEGYNKAMRDVIKALASSGIKTVDYASGYSRRLDSAVRQNILWGIKECNQNTADMVGKEFGADGYEISYHSNPRPSHVEMGGRQYAIGRARTINGVHYPSFEKEAEPFLNEPNCLHFKFSILLGISQPAHDKDQLEQFKANDKKTFEFEGKKYTGYEGTQLQRRIENAVKNNKDLLDAAKASGNKELEREAREKINLLTSKYHQLSNTSGLPTKMERMSTIKGKSVDNFRKSGIIKEAANSAIRNTGKVLEYNPDASFKVSIPEYSKELNDVISGACKEVAELGGKDGLEHLCLVDLDNKRIVYRETGDESSVGNEKFWEFVKENSNSRFCFVHNHNKDGCFSETDMKTLIKVHNIEGFTAVRIDGTIYHAVRTKLLGQNGKTFDELFEKELKPINDLSRSGKITSGERTRMREEMIVDTVLERYTKGLLEFE